MAVDDASCGGLFDPHYNAHVPGRVVLFFRQPGDGSADGSGAGSSSGCAKGGSKAAGGAAAAGGQGAGQAAAQQLGMALVDTTSRAVRRLRLSPAIISDHFIDKVRG